MFKTRYWNLDSGFLKDYDYNFQDNLVLGDPAHTIVITMYCILVTAAGEMC